MNVPSVCPRVVYAGGRAPFHGGWHGPLFRSGSRSVGDGVGNEGAGGRVAAAFTYVWEDACGGLRKA